MSYFPRCKFGKYNTFYENIVCKSCEFGDFTYIAPGTKINNTLIGKFCSIGPDCKIGLGKHPTSSYVSTHPIFFSTSKQAQITFVKENSFAESERIEIGNDVWIGANVMIMDGVKIEDGAIIAAGAFVVKDVPAYAVVGGTPAQIINFRFSKKQINFLHKVKWFEKDESWLRKHVDLFQDINRFQQFFSDHKSLNEHK